MGISIWQLLIILAIVLLLFGTKRLKNIGSDIGGAIKSFQKAVKDKDKDGDDKTTKQDKENEKIAQKESGRVIDGEVASKSEAASKSNDKL